MHNDGPAVAKQIFPKIALLFGVIVFAICLLGMTLVPMLAGRAGALTALMASQAAIIAVVTTVVFSWLSDWGQSIQAQAVSNGTTIDASPRADLDLLTQVPNQRSLTVKLLELLALGERYGNNLSVAVIGIDHLKDVGEGYTQRAADCALVAIARELLDTLRMPDVLGRWSEDQFIAILPETTLEGARHIGERLRAAVPRAQFEGKRGVVLTLTASVGVTAFRMGDDLQELLSRAQRAVDAAKDQGRNRVIADLAA